MSQATRFGPRRRRRGKVPAFSHRRNGARRTPDEVGGPHEIEETTKGVAHLSAPVPAGYAGDFGCIAGGWRAEGVVSR